MLFKTMKVHADLGDEMFDRLSETPNVTIVWLDCGFMIHCPASMNLSQVIGVDTFVESPNDDDLNLLKAIMEDC